MIRCIVLEDEKAARGLIMGYIEKVPFLHCMGVYESGIDIPVDSLSQAQLLFLDIQLPVLDGISFVKSLDNPPKVIVTSAYPDHALDAFEIAVADYLLKPFSFERFLKAVNRVRLTNTPTDEVHYLYADKTTYKVMSSDILYLKAEVDYVRVVTSVREVLILDSLRNWSKKLSSQGFVQIHRSYLARVNAIRSVSSTEVELDQLRLPLGASFRTSVMTAFGGK